MSYLKKTQVYGTPPKRDKLTPTPARTAEAELRLTPFPAELGRSRPPPPRRITHLEGDRTPDSIPEGGPAWMQRAQRMANALLAALESGEISDTTEAAIDRAWTAWELNGASDRQVAKVAHLSHRAHTAIHGTRRAQLERPSCVAASPSSWSWRWFGRCGTSPTHGPPWCVPPRG
jgi:hypothetical protein